MNQKISYVLKNFQETKFYGPATFLRTLLPQDLTMNTTVELDNNKVISIREEGPTPGSSSLAQGLVEAEKFLKKSVKQSTRNQYDRVYQIWKDFCQENKLSEFEAGHEALASCLSLVMLEGSLAKVSMLSAAIANEHRAHLKTSPTSHESIAQLFRAFRLCTHNVRNPVQPFTDDLIRKLIDHLYLAKHGHNAITAPLVIWRTVWRIVMEYHTLGRWSDIGKLKRPDLTFEDSPSLHLTVCFSEGKNQAFNQKEQRIVAADLTETKYCPVKLTQNYFRFLGSNHCGYLVPACDPKGKPDQNKAVPYGGCLDDLKRLLATLGIEGRYGEHSGKRGAATQAAENGMTVEALKRFGGWKSDSMPVKYADRSISSKIEMSKMLQKRL